MIFLGDTVRGTPAFGTRKVFHVMGRILERLLLTSITSFGPSPTGNSLGFLTISQERVYFLFSGLEGLRRW